MKGSNSGMAWHADAGLPVIALCAGLLLALGGIPGRLSAQNEIASSGEVFGRIVKEIRIRGLRHTREDIVRNPVASRVGEKYTERTARDDYRWLDRLGVFSSVLIRPELVDEGVVLQVDVRETVPRLPYPSLNVTGENGVSVGAGVKATSVFGIGTSFSGSMRGWELDAREGNNQFLATVEYRYEIREPRTIRIGKFGFYLGAQLAAFADLGTAWDGSDELGRPT